MRIRFIILVLLLVVAFRQSPAAAEGALAVALVGDVATEGAAFGDSYNYATVAQAKSRALIECRRHSSSTTKKFCTVVETFSNQCAAVSLDPKPGTPGIGWAVARDKRTAESQALAKCAKVAGAERRAACEVRLAHCDSITKLATRDFNSGP